MEQNVLHSLTGSMTLVSRNAVFCGQQCCELRTDNSVAYIAGRYEGTRYESNRLHFPGH
jgi:hypothetical protein